MQKQTARSLDVELMQLDDAVARMGGMVEKLLSRSHLALERHNPAIAEDAVRSDDVVDALEREVQELAIELIGTRRLAAEDLRHALAVLKISADLERIGDLGKNIARRAGFIASHNPPRHVMIGLKHMTKMAACQLKAVLDAWSVRDREKASSVWNEDAQLDALYSSVFRDSIAWMVEDSSNIEPSTHLMIVAKNLERIGDHTTNIAEQISFLITGIVPRIDRKKRDDTSTSVKFSSTS